MNGDILNQPGRHRLGDNLYLWVRSPTNRQFIYRYRADGQRRDKTLGSARRMTIEQAHAAAAKFRQQLAQTSSPAPVTDAAPALPIAGPRSFVRASTIGALPARTEAIERTLGQLTRDLHRLQQEFDEITVQLRRLELAIALRTPVVGMVNSRDTAVVAEPVDDAPSTITQSPIVQPLLSTRPTAEEVKCAVESYYNSQTSVGVKPTITECGTILQQNGYCTTHSYSFVYQKIRPFWPAK